MIFYSLPFLFFFLVLIVALQFTKTTKQQHVIFLVANIIFYAYWDYRFLLLLALVIIICYYCTVKYDEKRSRIYVLLPVLICLGILIVCKYLNFFIDSFATAFHISNISTLNIILPLGVSFYLFQAMSYVFDVKNGVIQSEKSLLRLAVYISFFPQITSGPIVKAHDFLPQLDHVHRIKKVDFYEGLQQFVFGLTKKVVFADRIGVAVNAVYSAPLAYNNISIIWTIIGYSLQIYFDFSGYSDMAIGIAKILGFDLGRNFDLPYLAKNPSDFWRRWHISLSSWFRDYVYIPLGGNRKGKFRTYYNLFITMLLSGIWHGANWTFLIWGFFHGLGSVIHKKYSEITKQPVKNSISDLFSIIFTFVFVSLLWVVFRSSDMNQACQILSGLFRGKGITYVNVYVVVYFCLTVTWNLYAKIKNKGHVIDIKLNLEKFTGQVLFFLWIFLIIIFMYVGDSAFIYAQF